MATTYDLAVVGSSFASAFFLREVLEDAPADAEIVVLERGERVGHDSQLDQRGRLAIDQFLDTYRNVGTGKPWVHTVAFGGTSLRWFGCTPRMLPADFNLQSRYGVGRDWPIDYDDLESDYCRAEQIMGVSGPSDDSPFRRSASYPLPPHRFTKPGRRLKEAYPDAFFALPAARFSRPFKGNPACCGNGSCALCPIDAKFTILNGLLSPFEDDRVDVRTGARVTRLHRSDGTVGAVSYRDGWLGRTRRVEADRVALGANALFNPAILQRSGFDHALIGRNLVEQVSSTVVAKLDGMEGFHGSTSLTGHGYMFYDGEHRSEHAGCLVETSNMPRLRHDDGKWAEKLELKFIFEDLPQRRNRVTVEEDALRPVVDFRGRSDYAKRGLERVSEMVEEMLAPLPVESAEIERNRTEAHIIGTTVMGADPDRSVVDSRLRMHGAPNVFVLGSGAFPTAAPANPTLTLAALSLRAGRDLQL